MVRVFPTLVGVFPRTAEAGSHPDSLPHARGGVSSRKDVFAEKEASSPRSWGCFRVRAGSAGSDAVFPTLVGVFPTGAQHCRSGQGLPHARGGVSLLKMQDALGIGSSPRSWGCFLSRLAHATGYRVFPTLVGVFLILSMQCFTTQCLPHARGGVSHSFLVCFLMCWSSPRSWGCFRDERRDLTREVVFPTLVGVFLNSEPFRPLISGLPHARGGVSSLPSFESSVLGSSPRSWGCFQGRGRSCCHTGVFPTLVGVFPMY